MNAALPPDEEERLAALRDAAILDTPPEQAWDDLVLIASEIAQTPIALTSLVDEDRQWFKARVGLDATQTPRDQAFCAHAILGRGVFEVNDATQDVRFRDNPLVTGEPQIRFYAGAPIYTPNGHALGTLCVIDRTPRKLTAAQRTALEALARQASMQLGLRQHGIRLRNSVALTEATLEAAGDAIVCVDLRNQILLCNERFRTMFGWTVEDTARGKPNPMAGPGLHLFREPEAFHRAMAEQDGQPGSDVFTILPLNDGRVLERYSRPAVANGGTIGRVNCYRDVTERRQLETLKNEFVATVSHELRTPLTSIRGALGLVESGVLGELPAQAREFVSIARTNSDRLIRLVGDILDLEKLESGKLTLQPKALDVRALLELAAGNVRGMADAASVPLEVHASVEHTYGDEDRLVQVLTNLISNAVKFSPAGSPVTLAAEPSEDGGVRFTVGDRGPGIPEQARHRLFRRFQQLEQGDARPKGGTGLGLAISKAIVEQHRGAIGASARDGGGSTFWFSLPAEGHAASGMSQARDGARPRVLVVDDDASFRQVVAQQLRPLGVEIVEANDGSEALALARRTHPTLIVLDIAMPRLDGYELVEALRREQPRPALLVYSARRLDDGERQQLLLGETHFLTKGAASEAEFVALAARLVHPQTRD